MDSWDDCMDDISSGNISMNCPCPSGDDDEIGIQRDGHGWSSGSWIPVSGDDTFSGCSFVFVFVCLSTSILVFLCLCFCLLGIWIDRCTIV